MYLMCQRKMYEQIKCKDRTKYNVKDKTIKKIIKRKLKAINQV